MHTDVREWVKGFRRNGADSRSRAVLEGMRGLHNGLFFTITTRYPLGTNVFDRDWDLLIVLDACRVDALRQVASEFDFLDHVDSMWSVGSSSHEWLCKTFTREHAREISESIHLSANPHVAPTFEERIRPPREYAIPFMSAKWDVVGEEDFKYLEMFLDSAYEGAATAAPDELTDYAIQAGREFDFDRMVVHYFQPHRPYIGNAYREQRPLADVEDKPWDALKAGEVTKSVVWDLYLENLRLVLESVALMLENVDADTVAITADHGDLFGELGQYGHPEGLPHPSLKKVPWAETTASDERTHDPGVEIQQTRSEVDVEDRLRQLGYV